MATLEAIWVAIYGCLRPRLIRLENNYESVKSVKSVKRVKPLVCVFVLSPYCANQLYQGALHPGDEPTAHGTWAWR